MSVDSSLSYSIPKREDEFKESLRLGRYNTYLLVDFDNKDLIDELKSAIGGKEGQPPNY